ncbi:hypothetical protein E2C01_028412 [Portunus trituberculatus]|uniref:Uncharacterized protein n=1 Tax=Portunus trituberculatus TaxID=210409 RepID=A0A5B7ENK2_PORTR|nr:hypothetical protein [Portunus trituberculatus]
MIKKEWEEKQKMEEEDKKKKEQVWLKGLKKISFIYIKYSKETHTHTRIEKKNFYWRVLDMRLKKWYLGKKEEVVEEARN